MKRLEVKKYIDTKQSYGNTPADISYLFIYLYGYYTKFIFYFGINRNVLSYVFLSIFALALLKQTSKYFISFRSASHFII